MSSIFPLVLASKVKFETGAPKSVPSAEVEAEVKAGRVNTPRVSSYTLRFLIIVRLIRAGTPQEQTPHRRPTRLRHRRCHLQGETAPSARSWRCCPREWTILHNDGVIVLANESGARRC